MRDLGGEDAITKGGAFPDALQIGGDAFLSFGQHLVRKEERHFPAKIQAGIISDSFGQGTPFLIACDCETEKPSGIGLTTSL